MLSDSHRKPNKRERPVFAELTCAVSLRQPRGCVAAVGQAALTTEPLLFPPSPPRSRGVLAKTKE